MKATLSEKGKTEIISSSSWLILKTYFHSFYLLCVPEKEWRDKQNSVDTLKDTIERQKKDLDRLRKEVGDKEMLCSVFRVHLFEGKLLCLLIQHAFCIVF